jgi:hypothetical protein
MLYLNRWSLIEAWLNNVKPELREAWLNYVKPELREPW